MKLYLIVRRNDACNYDEYEGHVVRAASARSARAMCPAGDETKECWTDPGRSTCSELSSSGNAEVILSAFKAG